MKDLFSSTEPNIMSNYSETSEEFFLRCISCHSKNQACSLSLTHREGDRHILGVRDSLFSLRDTGLVAMWMW